MTSIYEALQIDPNAALPIIAQIQRQIGWLITSGKLQPGERLPPIRELAGQLGVHMHTIRFAYQRLEAEGLVSMRQGRGTVVLEGGPRLLTAPSGSMRSFSIGVLVPGLNPFYLPLLRGIEDACREIPAMVLLSNTQDNPLLAETTLQQMIAKNVDGLILVSTGFDWSPAARNFPPAIFVDEPNVQKNAIQFDAEGAGYQATQHLIEHGHSAIGLIRAPLIFPQTQAVYQGYLKAHREAGLAVNDRWIQEVPGFKAENGYEGMQELLRTGEKPTAVFAIADSLAIGALRAIRAHGLRVPEDIALAGNNDIEFAELVDPPLTTVSFPAYQAGVAAVKSLETLRAGRQLTPSTVSLATHLVIRKSCGC